MCGKLGLHCYFDTSAANIWLPFKQWNHGTFVFGRNFHNLEDKVDFEEWVDYMNHVVWTQCLLARMLINYGTVCIKVSMHGEFERLWSCCILMGGEIIAMVIDFGAVKITTLVSKAEAEAMRPCGYVTPVRIGKSDNGIPTDIQVLLYYTTNN